MMRPGFLLFCLYVMCYLVLRASGEIVHARIQVQTRNGPAASYVVAADALIPRWRRQFYRALFSAPMVAEEEGRRLADGGRDLAHDAGQYGRDLLPD